MLPRRNLFRWMLAGAGGLTLSPSRLLAHGDVADDEPWLASIAAKKHRAFFDIRSFMIDGYAFKKAATLRGTLMNSYGASANEIGIAFGAGSNGLAHVLGPDLWEEYRVGARLTAAYPDLADALKADRGVGTQMAAGVAEMIANGVRVLACRNTIARWSRDFAAKSGEPYEAVQAKILKGLSPGVEPVPAMVAAAVIAQARDLSYVAIG